MGLSKPENIYCISGGRGLWTIYTVYPGGRGVVDNIYCISGGEGGLWTIYTVYLGGRGVVDIFSHEFHDALSVRENILHEIRMQVWAWSVGIYN